MDARVDLNELARRENEQVEWKENVADIDDAVATLVTFANDLQNWEAGTRQSNGIRLTSRPRFEFGACGHNLLK